MLELASRFADRLSVRESKTIISDGVEMKECSHYSVSEQRIYMDENTDSDEYSETFRHEYGHFTDDMLGRVSESEQFGAALASDRSWFDRGRSVGAEAFREMCSELSESDAIYSRYVSDILSGVFLNDTEIREVYADEGMPFYGHSTEYWLSREADEKIIEKEVFANLYAIYLKGDTSDIGFVERWFPNVTGRFLSELTGAAYG